MTNEILSEIDGLLKSFLRDLARLEVFAITNNDMEAYHKCVALRWVLTSEEPEDGR